MVKCGCFPASDSRARLLSCHNQSIDEIEATALVVNVLVRKAEGQKTGKCKVYSWCLYTCLTWKICYCAIMSNETELMHGTNTTR